MNTAPISSLRALLVTAAGGALVATLAGCAGGATTAAPPTESPLAPYFDVLYGGGTDEQMQAQNKATQDLAAACMKEQGFPYRPDSSSGVFRHEDVDGPSWGSREFAEQYGYGVVRNPFSGGTGSDDGSGEYVDPNADYLATLSESERAAWEEALYGPPTGELEGEFAATDYDWTTAGCLGAASHQAELDAGFAGSDPEFTALIDEMEALSQKAMTTDAVVAAERGWSDCLASAGHPGFEHKSDPSADIAERFAAIVRPGEAPSAADSVESAETSPAALDELAEEEVDLAVADFDCAESSGYEATLAAEQQRLDQEFVDANRTQLDALVAAHGRE
ncbi:hypothetical protein ACEXQB_009045 [Herbiconiux sp. P18]|uniref:hypothetical protein n=1 Tax=Herbiconiux liangxiaofengii TaxID=3342795 RepID=UPI0035B9F755